MKRLTIALLCLCLMASVSFAAKKSVKYLPVPAAETSAPVSHSTSGSSFIIPSIAAVGLSNTGLGISMATVRMEMSRESAIEFGFGSTQISQVAGTNPNGFFMAKYESDLSTKGNIRTYWAGQLNYSSYNAVILGLPFAVNATTFSGILGAELRVGDQLGIYGDLALVSVNMASGNTTIGVGNGASQIYSGARIYF